MQIIIATGGSGGHIFPALDVASQLRTEGHIVYFAGTFGEARQRIEAQGYALSALKTRGLITDSFKSVLISFCSMIKSIFESLRIVRQIKPEVIVGFGGYGAFPVVLAGTLLGIPTVIHEQNVLPGRANRLLAKFVKRIAVSFQASQQYFNEKKTIFTGCPYRQVSRTLNRQALREEFQLESDKFTILVLGGSQGSHRINQEFMQAIPLLKQLVDFQVIHMTGESDYTQLKKQYSRLDIFYCVFPFLEEIDKAYSAADLVISRAGAVTITEIAAYRLPAILIPYPWAGGHQKANAEVLVEASTAKILEEDNLSRQTLQENVKFFLERNWEKDELDQRLASISRPDAAQQLVNTIIELKNG